MVHRHNTFTDWRNAWFSFTMAARAGGSIAATVLAQTSITIPDFESGRKAAEAAQKFAEEFCDNGHGITAGFKVSEKEIVFTSCRDTKIGITRNGEVWLESFDVTSLYRWAAIEDIIVSDERQLAALVDHARALGG